MNKQNKNIIKTVLYAFLCLFAGEGVLGLGIYWPVLILLSDLKGVYWISFFFGLLVSEFYGLRIGIPSLLLVVFVALASMLVDTNRDSAKWMVFFAVLANFIFDKAVGLNWSIWESGLVLLVGLWSFRGYKHQEIIKINF